MKCENAVIQQAVLQEIADTKAAVKAQKRTEEETQKRAEEQRAAEVAMGKTTLQKKFVIHQRRIPGKHMTFFVFQGNTYDYESRGDYIWAPVSNKAGNTFHHWDRLLDVRPGDIILHGCSGYVQAISTAKGECYECNQPDELRTDNLWIQEGRKVDCDYIPIKYPMKILPRLCSTCQSLDDELFWGTLNKVIHIRTSYMHQMGHYQIEKIFTCLNEEHPSDVEWGLTQAQAFANEFAKKWVVIKPYEMSFIEIKLLVTTACYLEKIQEIKKF